MTIKNLRYSFILLALFAFAGTAAAQRPALDTASTTSSLEMTAEVHSTLQLNLAGTALTGSNSTGLFAIDFGDVDALGLSTLATGVTKITGATGTLYKAAYTLSPVFTGFGSMTADVTVEAGSGDNQGLAREGATLLTDGGAAPTTAVGILSNVANESSNGREVGIFISKTEVAGLKNATLIYTVSVN